MRFSGSGASGSFFASRTGFVTGLAASTEALSTVLGEWAAARPGLSTDFLIAGFAAVADETVDFTLGAPAARGNLAAGFTGTSRVSELVISVLRLAS
jgi:hypothetical protein